MKQDMTEVLDRVPIFALAAGWSLGLTALSAAFVAAGMASDVLLKGEAAWGALGSCVFLYAAVWIVSASYGVGEMLDDKDRPPGVLGVLLAMRAVLCAVGVCWVFWGEARHWQEGVALVMAGGLIGAVVEGVCCRRVAQVLGVSVWRAARISMKGAGRGTRLGVQGGRSHDDG